jgi:hypothetical protein
LGSVAVAPRGTSGRARRSACSHGDRVADPGSRVVAGLRGRVAGTAAPCGPRDARSPAGPTAADVRTDRALHPLPGRVAGFGRIAGALLRTWRADAAAGSIHAHELARRSADPRARRVAGLRDLHTALSGVRRARDARAAGARRRTDGPVDPVSRGVAGLSRLSVAAHGHRHARAGAISVAADVRARGAGRLPLSVLIADLGNISRASLAARQADPAARARSASGSGGAARAAIPCRSTGSGAARLSDASARSRASGSTATGGSSPAASARRRAGNATGS